MPLILRRTPVTAEDLAVTDPLYKVAEPDTERSGAGTDIHGYVFAILERLKDTSRGRKASICQIEKHILPGWCADANAMAVAA